MKPVVFLFHFDLTGASFFMADILGWQTDYLFFFSGLTFFFLAAVCFSINREERRRFPWNWLGLYGIAYGTSEMLELLSISLGGEFSFTVINLSAMVISFVFLAEFGRSVAKSVRAGLPGRWILIPLFMLAAPGGLAGHSGLDAALHYTFGLGAGIWSAVFLYLSAKNFASGTRRWLMSASTALGLNALVCAVTSPAAPFFPASVINEDLFIQALGFPVQLFRGAVVIWAAVAVWGYWQKRSTALIGPGYSSTKYKYTVLTAAVLCIVLIAGWAFTQHLGRHARDTLFYESGGNISALTNYLKGELSMAEHAVVALAGNPDLRLALASGKEDAIERANLILDQFQHSFNASVCYLMDVGGNTIAASNRYTPESFVGNNYGFRPYYRQAVEGRLGRYFAMGVTSGERGYYASCPVRDNLGNIAGVAVVKKNINKVEFELSRYPYCFLLDPNGVVFLSSRPDMVFTSLWPLDEDVRRKIFTSRQFGAGTLKTLLPKPSFDGEGVVISSRQYLVARRFVNPEGWSVMLLTPADRILSERLLGILATFSLSALTISFFAGSQRLTEYSARIAASEANYRAIFNAASDAIFIHDKNTGDILDVNRKMLEMYGYSPEEVHLVKLEDIAAGDLLYNAESFRRMIGKAAEGEPQLFEWLARDRSGRHFWVEVSLKQAVLGNKERLLAVVRDITGRKQTEGALRESEAKYRTIFENTGTALAILESDTTISLVNAEFAASSGYSKQEIEGKKKLTEFVAAGEREKMAGYHRLRRIDASAAPRNYEFEFLNREGSIRNIYITVAMIPGTERSVISLLDITDRKRAEEKLRHLSQHDPLTGLYNRASFEEAMRRLESGGHYPAGIILCDVDGLKLVNDSLGHEAGDRVLKEAAGTIRKCFRDIDMVARIGGDEFAVLLPGSSPDIVEKAAHRIKKAMARHNETDRNSLLSLSVGFAVRTGPGASMAELFKEADNNMYKEKFHSSKSARSTIVKTLMKALEARDIVTGGHADRMQKLVADLALSIGMPDHVVADLRLLARFHDIGKVGIPDRILFKPASLTPDEAAEMRRHCEIGHRIAQSVPELVSIADFILKHHEWWNGEGYPNGLKGEDIPLECRIIAIADAYDAMTSNRPYRKARSPRKALAEIRRCAGTQFDPGLVEKFVHLLEKRA